MLRIDNFNDDINPFNIKGIAVLFFLFPDNILNINEIGKSACIDILVQSGIVGKNQHTDVLAACRKELVNRVFNLLAKSIFINACFDRFGDKRILFVIHFFKILFIVNNDKTQNLIFSVFIIPLASVRLKTAHNIVAFAVVTENNDVFVSGIVIFVESNRIIGFFDAVGFFDIRLRGGRIAGVGLAVLVNHGKRNCIFMIAQIAAYVAIIINRFVINGIKRCALIREQLFIGKIEFGHDRELRQDLTEDFIDSYGYNIALPFYLLIADNPVNKLPCPVIGNFNDDFLLVVRIIGGRNVGNLHEGFDGLRISAASFVGNFFLFEFANRIVDIVTQNNNGFCVFKRNIV